MEVIDVVHSLVGPTASSGDSALDEIRLANLEDLQMLVEELVYDLRLASNTYKSPQASSKKIGETAHEFLLDLRKQLPAI